MEARLLAALRLKLDQLEHKMQAQRRDLVADFQRHYCDLVCDVPSDTAANVRRAITAAFADYPTLRPELLAADSHPLKSPGPLPPPAAAGSADAAPVGTRERDYDLEGFFTHTYLPLLDSSPVPPRSTLADALGPVPPSPPFALLPESPFQGTGEDQAVRMEGTTEQGGEPGHAPARLLSLPQPFSVAKLPNDSTRSTDDLVSSVSSDKSDSKPPRSALRRTSSMSKKPQSPRRVRFEFMGAEVLPTTSPRPTESLARRPSSPGPDGDRDDDEEEEEGEEEEEEDDDDDDDDDATFHSNLGDDTAEEERVPPRKVSSSDALRALSRAPLEGGAIWTVVNPDMDEVTSDEMDPVASTPPSAAAVLRWTTLESSKAGQRGPAAGISDKEPEADVDDDDSSDDDGFLAMANTTSRKKSPNAPAPQVPTKAAHGSAPASRGLTDNKSLASRTIEEEISVESFDDEEVFYFEAGGLSAPMRPRPKPTPVEEDLQESRSEHEEPDMLPTDTSEDQMSIYATSPAMPIQRQSWGSRPSTASNVKVQAGSLGSYKGQPLMMPIVPDPEVLAQANSVEASKMRVNGVDDETAMEEGSPPRFPSTPRSFRERFITEEIMGQAKRKEDEDNETSRQH